MVDMMVVLVIIFMVVPPMLQKAHQVDLAPTNNAHEMQDADKDDAIAVAVTRDGHIFLGNTETLKADLTGQIKERLSTRLDNGVYVDGEAGVVSGGDAAIVVYDPPPGVDHIGRLTDATLNVPC